jgi:primosomal replication protein N
MWQTSGLENERFGAHIDDGMAQKSRTKLLEVAIVGRSASSWEWSVRFGTEVLICGVESSHTGARFAGNDALFLDTRISTGLGRMKQLFHPVI